MEIKSIYTNKSRKLREEIDEGVCAGQSSSLYGYLANHFDVNKITVSVPDEPKVKVSYSIPAKGTYVTEVKRTPREECNLQRNTDSNEKSFTVGLITSLKSRRTDHII